MSEHWGVWPTEWTRGRLAIQTSCHFLGKFGKGTLCLGGHQLAWWPLHQHHCVLLPIERLWFRFPFGICLFCFLNSCLFVFFYFFWTICYTFHNQTMLKFYFNTMTKTRFTLKYSRIHSAQACGSKAEWKTKAKLLYKELAFPFSPLPSPESFCISPPPTWFPIQESCILTPDGIYFVLFLFLFFTNVA